MNSIEYFDSMLDDIEQNDIKLKLLMAEYESMEKLAPKLTDLCKSLDRDSGDEIGETVLTLESLGLFGELGIDSNVILHVPNDEQYDILVSSVEGFFGGMADVMGKIVESFISTLVGIANFIVSLFGFDIGSSGGGGGGGSSSGSQSTRQRNYDKAQTVFSSKGQSMHDGSWRRNTRAFPDPSSLIRDNDGNDDDASNDDFGESYSKLYNEFKSTILDSTYQVQDESELADSKFWDLLNVFIDDEDISPSDRYNLGMEAVLRIRGALNHFYNVRLTTARMWGSINDSLGIKLTIPTVEPLNYIVQLTTSLLRQVKDYKGIIKNTVNGVKHYLRSPKDEVVQKHLTKLENLLKKKSIEDESTNVDDKLKNIIREKNALVNFKAKFESTVDDDYHKVDGIVGLYRTSMDLGHGDIAASAIMERLHKDGRTTKSNMVIVIKNCINLNRELAGRLKEYGSTMIILDKLRRTNIKDEDVKNIIDVHKEFAKAVYHYVRLFHRYVGPYNSGMIKFINFYRDATPTWVDENSGENKPFKKAERLLADTVVKLINIKP